ncbi:MAG: efflux RND transporter periplasmic adaptor subunit [Paracoccaceae bacterium]
MRSEILGLGLLVAMTVAVPQGLRADTAEAGTAEAAAPESTAVLPAITVSTVGLVTLQDRVIVSGLIGPVERVQVAPLIEGQPIETLLADVGDMVTEGQVLATLSTTTLELQLSQSNASLASARATIAQAEAQMLEAQSAADEAVRVNDRTAALREQGTASQAAADTAAANAISATARVTVAAQSLEAARAQLALVEAQMANAELSLERTDVVAPVSGAIVERNAALGSVATAAGDPMFVIVKENALELRGDVAEVDMLRLAVGQPASLRMVGLGAPLAGSVRLVEPAIDTTTRLGRVRISIEDPATVRSGMFAEAEVIAAEHEALAIPVTALGTADGKPVVMKVTDGAVTRVAVVPGIRDGALVEILEGLSEGDMVVTKAGAFVRDGDRINPVPAASN